MFSGCYRQGRRQVRRAGTAAKAAACALSLLLVACGIPGMSGCLDEGSRSISGDCTLIRESAKILRDMNVVQGLRAHLANRDQANWSELAATVGVAQDREDMLWSAITGEALEECPIPELSREEVICWHQLMGDTIEAMHDGVLVTDDRAKALAIRFSSLGGMPHALAGLKRLACQRSSGPKQYGRDFYAGIQRRTLSFLQDALDCSHANANTQA